MTMQQPLSLYLELEPHRRADLEITARAALAFAALVRETAFILDPSAEVRLDLQSGTEGSLSLNTIIQKIRGEDKGAKKTLLGAAFVVICWLTADIRAYGVSELLDQLKESEQAEGLTENDLLEIRKIVEIAVEKRVAEPQVQRLFRELERDSAVKGVGATTRLGQRPERIVPRDRFSEMAGHASVVEEDIRLRRTTSVETVTLISPVLVPSKRRWKIRLHGHEFGAAMRDERFLERLFTNKRPIPMIDGIEMDVVLETREEKLDGVWTVKERSILSVLHVGVGLGGRQIELFSDSPETIDDEEEN